MEWDEYVDELSDLLKRIKGLDNLELARLITKLSDTYKYAKTVREINKEK